MSVYVYIYILRKEEAFVNMVQLSEVGWGERLGGSVS